MIFTNTQKQAVSIKYPPKHYCGDSSCAMDLPESNCMLLLVSDGVGTKPKDYLASATVSRTIIDYLMPLKEIKNDDVEAAVSGANEILKQGVQGVKGMLATLSLLIWDKGGKNAEIDPLISLESDHPFSHQIDHPFLPQIDHPLAGR